MELATISEVSRFYRVTTRTLRYYEQLGLIESSKVEGYAYRTYNQDALRRLQQIIILRKLNIPLKQIASILKNEDVATAIDVFKERVKEVTGRIESLTTIKEIIIKLIEGLEISHQLDLNQNILSDEAILREIGSLSLTYLDLKEDKSMDDLIKNERPYYGYEVWVTIPEDMNVPAPLVKKQATGGMYVAHTITLGNFHEWELLSRWVHNSEKYEANTWNDNGECMGGLLEEHLNYVYHCHLNWPENDEHQIDLLFPIRLKNS